MNPPASDRNAEVPAENAGGPPPPPLPQTIKRPEDILEAKRGGYGPQGPALGGILVAGKALFGRGTVSFADFRGQCVHYHE